MSFDPDRSLPQVQRAEGVQIQKKQLKTFEFDRKVTEELQPFDAKTLAARRKRLELRRLRLMATTCDGSAEPLAKRLKGISPNPEEEGLGMSVVGKVERCQDGRTEHMTRYISLKGEGDVDGAGHGQEQATCQDSDAGATLESRLSNLSTGSVSLGHCVVSICGRSREMEDAAVAVPSFLSLPSPHAGLEGSGRTKTFDMFGVFDGHGGSQAAEICKQRMSAYLAAEMTATLDSTASGWESCMQSCFLRLDGELCGTCPNRSQCPCTSITTNSCRDPLVLGSVGTTAVVAVVGLDYLVVSNCGDSRAVLCRGGQAVPLSCDHKASRPDEVARIEAMGGSVFNWEGHRVCGVLAVSRALGDSYLKPYVSGLPDVTFTARTDEDECLILASDGLWDVLSSEYVCSVAQKIMAGKYRRHRDSQQCHPLFSHDNMQHFSGQQQPKSSNADVEDSPAQVLAALLTKLALGKQTRDNVSVVVVDLRHK